MDPKLKEELIDLAHLLHQAILADDDRIAEAALADLRAALGGEQVEGGRSEVEQSINRLIEYSNNRMNGPSTSNLQPVAQPST